MSVLEQTVRIVEAYIANVGLPANGVSASLSQLILDVHNTLSGLANAGTTAEATIDRSESAGKASLAAATSSEESSERKRDEMRKSPAVPPSQAVSNDSVTCLVCGKSAKTLKGHLTRTHQMDVNAYRAMFSLPKDFPMVAPTYSEKRRQLAVDSGLGDKLREGRRRKMAE